VKTPFPPGLEPLEDNPVVLSAVEEGLVTKSTDSPYVKVYGRGYVKAPPDVVWAAAKSPAPNVAMCSTDQQTVTENNDPAYEYSFLVHYTVNNILTVEWDDQWRFGTVVDAPFLAMMKHQKTQGSDLISLSEGTIEVDATDDPEVTELSFVEHLDATSASASDVLASVKHNYDSLVAVSHGNPVPACP
jgi:carbon monoxide dehydrogenase subunit G